MSRIVRRRIVLAAVAFAAWSAGPVALAVERCEADGRSINLNHGGMTANLTAVVRCTQDGRLTRELPYRDGKLDGVEVVHRWRFGGDVERVTTEFRAGRREGWRRQYGPNDRLLSEVSYADDREFGPARYFHPNGRVRRAVEKTSDEKTTIVEEYDDEGRLTRASCGTSSASPAGRGECRYRGFSGELRTVHEGGRPNVVGPMKNGLFDGVVLTHARDGTLQRRETLRAGLLDGPQQLFFETGKPSDEATFVNGVREPRYLRYYPGGDRADEWETQGDTIVRERNWYMNGQLRAETVREIGTGERSRVVARGFHDNGRPAYEGEFSERTPRVSPDRDRQAWFHAFRIPRTGADSRAALTEWGAYAQLWRNLQAEGVHIEYAEDGRRWRESTFKAGRRDGLTRSWHPTGQLAAEVTYANDRIVAAREWDRDGRLARDEEYLPDGSRRPR